MSGVAGASNDGSDEEFGILDSGAAVFRLRTRSEATVPGHVLLVGSPLDDLGGVAACLRRMLRWLAPLYEVVEGPLEPTKAGIEAQAKQLLKAVNPGDQVFVYYAGHGMQGLPGPELHDQPVTALLPIDAHVGGSSPGSRLIPGGDVVCWLDQLADACQAPQPKPFQRSRRRDEVEPSVTMVFECCHSAGVMGQWPASAAERKTILDTMGRRLDERARRGGADPLPRVVRVMASGRDEWAQGPTVNDVGLMTHALVDLLEQHPDEPWWAVMDRLQVQWREPTQHPEIAGPDALIPLSGRRLERPDEFWPCQRFPSGRWHCTLADGANCRPGHEVVLTSSLGVAEQARGRFELDDRGVLGIRVAADAALKDHRFAWATRPSPGRRAVVDVRGGDASARAELTRQLSRCARHVRDRGGEPSDRLSSSRVVCEHPRPRDGTASAVATFEVGPLGVVLRDRWGDAVARGGLDDRALWESWLDRLVVLDDWLAMERQAGGWSADGLKLRWGTWQDGRRRLWDESSPTVTTETPLWVELEASIACMPAFVSLFRVRADRAVEALTPHVPGGLPVADRYPLAGLGEDAEPLRLDWPTGLDDDGPRWEQLAVMVSDRPLPLALLRRGSVRGERGKADDMPRAARLSMLNRRYRLVRR